jgi:hypothetical protein
VVGDTELIEALFKVPAVFVQDEPGVNVTAPEQLSLTGACPLV